jgi:hypothetical protein
MVSSCPQFDSKKKREGLVLTSNIVSVYDKSDNFENTNKNGQAPNITFKAVIITFGAFLCCIPMGMVLQ